MMSLGFVQKNKKLYAYASALALITIAYNVIEGLVSVFFGLEDESMALFGFGVDSFVEVISGFIHFKWKFSTALISQSV